MSTSDELTLDASIEDCVAWRLRCIDKDESSWASAGGSRDDFRSIHSWGERVGPVLAQGPIGFGPCPILCRIEIDPVWLERPAYVKWCGSFSDEAGDFSKFRVQYKMARAMNCGLPGFGNHMGLWILTAICDQRYCAWYEKKRYANLGNRLSILVEYLFNRALGNPVLPYMDAFIEAFVNGYLPVGLDADKTPIVLRLTPDQVNGKRPKRTKDAKS